MTTLQQADSLIHRAQFLCPWIVTLVEVYPGLPCTLIVRVPGLSPLLKSVLVHHAHSLYMLLDCRPCGTLSWFTMHTHCACSWIVALVEIYPGSPCTLIVHSPGLWPLLKSVLVHHAYSFYMLLDCLPCLSWFTMHTHCTCSWIVALVEVYPGSPCTLIVHAPGLSPLLKSILVHHAHSF